MARERGETTTYAFYKDKIAGTEYSKDAKIVSETYSVDNFDGVLVVAYLIEVAIAAVIIFCTPLVEKLLLLCWRYSLKFELILLFVLVFLTPKGRVNSSSSNQSSDYVYIPYCGEGPNYGGYFKV